MLSLAKWGSRLSTCRAHSPLFTGRSSLLSAVFSHSRRWTDVELIKSHKLAPNSRDERLLRYVGREKWPKIWYSGLKTLKFKTRPSRVISSRAAPWGKEGREVVKGQFQPHAAVTDPRRSAAASLLLLLLLARVPSIVAPTRRILFLSPRNSPARTAIWHRRAVWIPNSIGPGPISLSRFRKIKGGSKIDSETPEYIRTRTCYVHMCAFYDLPSHAREITVTVSPVIGSLRCIRNLIIVLFAVITHCIVSWFFFINATLSLPSSEVNRNFENCCMCVSTILNWVNT